MKRCESRGRAWVFAEESSEHSRRRRRRSSLPITAVAGTGFLSHIPRARGGGRSPSRHTPCERGPTRRKTLEHLFGITGLAASQGTSIRRMPPFKTTSVTDGRALKLSVGVIHKVVTSTSTLDSLPLPLYEGRAVLFFHFRSVTPPDGNAGRSAPARPSHTTAAARPR